MILIGVEMLWCRYDEAIAYSRHIVKLLKELGHGNLFFEEAQRQLQKLEDQNARSMKKDSRIPLQGAIMRIPTMKTLFR